MALMHARTEELAELTFTCCNVTQFVLVDANPLNVYQCPECGSGTSKAFTNTHPRSFRIYIEG